MLFGSLAWLECLAVQHPARQVPALGDGWRRRHRAWWQVVTWSGRYIVYDTPSVTPLWIYGYTPIAVIHPYGSMDLWQ